MPHPFPHEYQVELIRPEGSQATLRGVQQEPELRGAPPLEFDGPGGDWSPETLLLGAAQLCFYTTLVALSRRREIGFSEFGSVIRGRLEKGAQGIVFTRIELEVSVKARPGEQEKLRELLLSAKKHCIISNALKTEVELKANLSEAAS